MYDYEIVYRFEIKPGWYAETTLTLRDCRDPDHACQRLATYNLVDYRVIRIRNAEPQGEVTCES